MSRDILIDRVSKRAKNCSLDPSYYFKVDNKWKFINWRDYHQMIRNIGKSLISLGVKADSKVAILSFGCLEWVSSCMAAQYIGAISVGIYTTSSLEEVFYILNHSDAEVLLVENYDRYINQIKPNLSKLNKVKIVLMNGEIDNEEILSFKQFLLWGENIKDSELDRMYVEVDKNQPATMIYTSGTTGNPKAVMLSHKSLAWTVKKAASVWNCNKSDSNISYLPLAHIAEQLFSVYAPIECGMQTYFISKVDAFTMELKEVRPTIFFGVPRVFEKIHEGIKEKLHSKPKILKYLLAYSSYINKQVLIKGYHNSKPSIFFNLQYKLFKKYLFNSIKNTLGLNRARAIFSGAAPISFDTLNFFLGMDMPIYELYGLSETTGPCTLNLQSMARMGSVGWPLSGTKIKIANDGEILIKGPHVFLAYYKDNEASKEVLKDEWFHTGDIGKFDDAGFLYITDRKKDLLITAGGKNVSPQNIESMLKSLPYVQSAVVVGDRKKYLCALLSPDKANIEKKAYELGVVKDLKELVSHKTILEAIQIELNKLNKRLAPVEQIKKYFLLDNEFSVDTGELTPTLKVKRKFINQKYQKEIEKLYQ